MYKKFNNNNNNKYNIILYYVYTSRWSALTISVVGENRYLQYPLVSRRRGHV